MNLPGYSSRAFYLSIKSLQSYPFSGGMFIESWISTVLKLNIFCISIERQYGPIKPTRLTFKYLQNWHFLRFNYWHEVYSFQFVQTSQTLKYAQKLY